MSSPSQLFSANYEEDDILDDLMGDDDTGASRGMYTQGGVIMPEGGANPCVIKVRRADFVQNTFIVSLNDVLHT